MDLRNRNLSSNIRTTKEATVKKTPTIRPNTASMAHGLKRATGLPDGSKSLSKIHPLGTIPKYLQKQRQRNASTSASASTVQLQPLMEATVEPPPTEQLQTVTATVTEAQLDAEYKQQTIDRLERQVQELLSELGYREQRIRELEANLYGAHHTLGEMYSMMQTHLKAQQPIMKKIAKESRVLLLLQMILDNQANSKGAARE